MVEWGGRSTAQKMIFFPIFRCLFSFRVSVSLGHESCPCFVDIAFDRIVSTATEKGAGDVHMDLRKVGTDGAFNVTTAFPTD